MTPITNKQTITQRIIDGYHRYLRKRKHRKYKELLEWRDELNDYEKKQLIPALKYRMISLKEDSIRIVNICSKENLDTFGAILLQLMKYRGVPITDVVCKAEAEKYFADIRKLVQEQFVNDLDEIIKHYDSINDLKDFALVLNETNHFCASITEIKDKLFFYNIQHALVIQNVNTLDTEVFEPNASNVIWMPFRVIAENMYSVAKSTSETIHHWHKEQLQWKTGYLNLKAHQVQLRNQLITIVFAIVTALAISAIFMSATNVYETHVLKNNLEHNNLLIDDIKRKNEDLEKQNVELNRVIQLQNQLKNKNNENPQ